MLFISLILLLLAIPLHSSKVSTVMIIRFAGLAFLYGLLISMNSFHSDLIGSISLYSGQFYVSTLSLGIEQLICLLASLVCFSLSLRWVNLPKELGLIFLFTALGGVLLISSSNLISLFLCLELQSLSIYILATLVKNNEKAISGGLMYFLLGALASCLILLGCAIIYMNTGCLDFHDLANMTQESNIGFIILLIGFLFKIGSAPLHNWTIIVYDHVPTYLVAWLAVLPKVSLLGVLVHLNELCPSNLLLVSALFSLVFGSVLGLTQNRIKRLIAYSGVSHIGFLLLALHVNTIGSLTALILYIVQYSLTSLILFLILLGKQTSRDEIEKISELRGLYHQNPLLATTLTVSLFSMAGLPFLIGFFAKLEVLVVALQNNYLIISLIAIILSVISAGYYLRVIQLAFKTTEVALDAVKIQDSNLAYVISFLTFSLVSFILNPLLWMNPIQLIVFSS